MCIRYDLVYNRQCISNIVPLDLVLLPFCLLSGRLSVATTTYYSVCVAALSHTSIMLHLPFAIYMRVRDMRYGKWVVIMMGEGESESE